MATTVFDKPIGTEIGQLSSLTTSDKTNLVNAINSLNSNVANLYGGGSAISNANDITETGSYVCNNSTTNTPATAHYVLLHYKYNATEASQLALRINNLHVYYRYKYNSTWSEWGTLL